MQNYHGIGTNQTTCTCLDYLPPKARLLTSTCDQPSKTRPYKPVIHYTKEAVTPNMSVAPSNITQNDDQLVTRQEHIMAQFPDVFQGVGKFPGEPYKIRLDPQVSAQANTVQACSSTPKTSFQSRNRQDVRSRCFKTSPGGYSMDQ